MHWTFCYSSLVRYSLYSFAIRRSLYETQSPQIIVNLSNWGNYAVPVINFFDIAIESDGPGQANGSYGYSAMLEIWAAANATESPVLMVCVSLNSSPEVSLFNSYYSLSFQLCLLVLLAPR